MMLNKLLGELSQQGAQLWVEDDALVIRARRGALAPHLRARLIEHKEQLLHLLRQRDEHHDGARLPALTPDPRRRHEPFPLTDIQQAYWLGRHPSFALGRVGIHVYEELDGREVNLERLEQAWQRVINRHDMLRAVVLPDGNQRILESAAYRIETRDLRPLTKEAGRAALAAIRERLSHRVYAPQDWPLFEIVACVIDDRCTRLHISIDALNLDMASFAIIFRDWVNFYEQPEQQVTPLELSYRDYALALDAWREAEPYRRSLDYWRRRATELPPAPALPLVQSPGSLTRQRFVRRHGRLDQLSWERVKDRAAHVGVTPAGLTLAAYAEVLGAWSQSLQFTLNVTLYNRLPVHPQVNELAGDFTSMILVGVDQAAGGNFEGRATRLQRQMRVDLEHRYVSGVQVLREVGRAQGKAAGELIMPVVFSSTLNQRPQGLLPLKRFGERVYNIIQTPQVSLDLQVYEEEGDLVFNLDAVEELFHPALLDEMCAAYSRLLQRLADAEEAWRETERRLIPPSQLRRRAVSNATEAATPEVVMQELVARQAAARPEQVAVISAKRTLTYGELEGLSNRLGRRLRQLGAVPDKLVAVVMEPGWEQVLAVLGILRAGSAYLPVDPSLPRERLWYLLENGEVEVVLTQSWIERKLAWPAGLTRLSLDTDDAPEIDDSPLDIVQKPEHLAYVIYTSGSSGQPKGVMIEHRSVVNRMLDINARFGVGPTDRVLALTGLHHDLSVYDLCGTLAAGATMVVPRPEERRDPASWARLMKEEGITVWNSVPALMEMLVEYLEHAAHEHDGPPSSLRLVLLAGDWIPVPLPDRIRSLIPSAQVISLGGPTETTVWDIFNPAQEIDPHWKSIPYGRPLSNARYYVLNEALEDCPDWVPGELCIGGAGLARGYWRDPAQTSEKFIHHPRTGERLYRSGDVGRYLPDGNLEFLGRKDFQIKIRGHRIEAGEVEEAIRQHPAAKAAVVMAEPEHGRDARLVAHVVAHEKPISGCDVSFSGPDGEQYEPRRTTLSATEQLDFKLRQPGLRQDLEDRPRIQLSRAPHDEQLKQAYTWRQSHRAFLDQPVSFEKISALLSCLASLRSVDAALPKYLYPSAGSLYPVQCYLYVMPERVEGMAAGAYYYHPGEHGLRTLTTELIPAGVHVSRNTRLFAQSAFSLFLVGHLRAVQPLYGELARDFCLLEAGYIGQLLMNEAPRAGIGLCPIGDLDFARLRQHFLVGDEHLFLHGLVGGGISAEQATSWPRPIQSTIESTPAAPSNAPDDQTPAHAFISHLEGFLKTKLPVHMVPSDFVLWDAFPLTSNGKVDRAELRKKNGRGVKAPEAAYVAPQTELEQVIAGVWKEVLGVEAVSVEANFFELGANSLQMVQVYSRLSHLTKSRVSMTEMFEYPSISSFAQFISAMSRAASPVQESDRRAAMRLRLQGQRRASGHQPLPGNGQRKGAS